MGNRQDCLVSDRLPFPNLSPCPLVSAINWQNRARIHIAESYPGSCHPSNWGRNKRYRELDVRSSADRPAYTSRLFDKQQMRHGCDTVTNNNHSLPSMGNFVITSNCNTNTSRENSSTPGQNFLHNLKDKKLEQLEGKSNSSMNQNQASFTRESSSSGINRSPNLVFDMDEDLEPMFKMSTNDNTYVRLTEADRTSSILLQEHEFHDDVRMQRSCSFRSSLQHDDNIRTVPNFADTRDIPKKDIFSLDDRKNVSAKGSSFIFPNSSIRNDTATPHDINVQNQIGNQCELIEITRHSVLMDSRTGERYVMVYGSLEDDVALKVESTDKASYGQRRDSVSIDEFVNANKTFTEFRSKMPQSEQNCQKHQDVKGNSAQNSACFERDYSCNTFGEPCQECSCSQEIDEGQRIPNSGIGKASQIENYRQFCESSRQIVHGRISGQDFHVGCSTTIARGINCEKVPRGRNCEQTFDGDCEQPFPFEVHEDDRNYQKKQSNMESFSQSYQGTSTLNLQSKYPPSAYGPISGQCDVMNSHLPMTAPTYAHLLHVVPHVPSDEVNNNHVTKRSMSENNNYQITDKVRSLYRNRRGISVNYLDLTNVGTLTASHLTVDGSGNCAVCRNAAPSKLTLRNFKLLEPSTNKDFGSCDREIDTNIDSYKEQLKARNYTPEVCHETNSHLSQNPRVSRVSCGCQTDSPNSNIQVLESHNCFQDFDRKSAFVSETQRPSNRLARSDQVHCITCGRSTTSWQVEDIACARSPAPGDVRDDWQCLTSQTESSGKMSRCSVMTAPGPMYKKCQKNYVACLCCAADIMSTFALPFHSMLEGWGLPIFIAPRDLELGGSKYETLAKCVEERCNGKIIVILSTSYPQSEECLFLTYFAKTLDPDAKSKNIIPVQIDKDVEIPSVLQGLSFIRYNHLFRNGWLKEKMIKAIAA